MGQKEFFFLGFGVQGRTFDHNHSAKPGKHTLKIPERKSCNLHPSARSRCMARCKGRSFSTSLLCCEYRLSANGLTRSVCMCSRVHISVMIRMHTSNLHVGHVSGLCCIWHCRTPSLRTSPACAYMSYANPQAISLSLSHTHTFTSFTHMRMYVCMYVYIYIYMRVYI